VVQEENIIIAKLIGVTFIVNPQRVIIGEMDVS